MRDHVVQRSIGDETEVECGGHRKVRLRFELAPAFVNVDLLLLEAQREATAGECLQLHAKHAGIKIDAGGTINGGKHQVDEMIDHC
jgi:hypothetical protein